MNNFRNQVKFKENRMRNVDRDIANMINNAVKQNSYTQNKESQIEAYIPEDTSSIVTAYSNFEELLDKKLYNLDIVLKGPATNDEYTPSTEEKVAKPPPKLTQYDRNIIDTSMKSILINNDVKREYNKFASIYQSINNKAPIEKYVNLIMYKVNDCIDGYKNIIDNPYKIIIELTNKILFQLHEAKFLYEYIFNLFKSNIINPISENQYLTLLKDNQSKILDEESTKKYQDKANFSEDYKRKFERDDKTFFRNFGRVMTPAEAIAYKEAYNSSYAKEVNRTREIQKKAFEEQKRAYEEKKTIQDKIKQDELDAENKVKSIEENKAYLINELLKNEDNLTEEQIIKELIDILKTYYKDKQIKIHHLTIQADANNIYKKYFKIKSREEENEEKKKNKYFNDFKETSPETRNKIVKLLKSNNNKDSIIIDIKNTLKEDHTMNNNGIPPTIGTINSMMAQARYLYKYKEEIINNIYIQPELIDLDFIPAQAAEPTQEGKGKYKRKQKPKAKKFDEKKYALQLKKMLGLK